MYINQAQAAVFSANLDNIASHWVVYDATLLQNLDPPPNMEFDYEDRKAILKSCTILVRLLDLDLACFPLTESSAQLYDADGNPIE